MSKPSKTFKRSVVEPGVRSLRCGRAVNLSVNKKGDRNGGHYCHSHKTRSKNMGRKLH